MVQRPDRNTCPLRQLPDFPMRLRHRRKKVRTSRHVRRKRYIHTMRIISITLLSLLTVAAFAQQQPAMPRDEKIEMVANDLHCLGRISDVSKDLADSRQVLLAIADNDIRTLREPRDDGSFRWASLQREEGGRVSDEK